VLAALTLLPAVLSLFGEKLRPKPTSRAVKLSHKAAEGRTFGARWVRLVTKVPVVTVLLVLGAIGVMAIPAKDLALSLPDNGSAEAHSPQRVTYDLIAKEFGPGYNSPLLVTANIITSTDPKGTVQTMANDISAIPGVLAVTKQTPNTTADLGLVRIVPQWGQSDPQTADLVQRLRAQESTWEQQLKVTDVLVTGQTAVAIDVSDQLSAALVPFGIVVVGLSLILLAIVFRSIAVPIKATLGYLLSIAAALGAVTATCMWGWLAGPLSISYIGPLVSFFPIILMGVLFGLAMDYEVFLVSQMREDFVHHGDAAHAIRTGFASSARVVTAAAIIMISVFAAFIPDGSPTIKPIAIGLATGVFVDAFLVRMTLVPAVLALLGKHAWWIPRSVDRALPSIDVEGQSLVKHVEQTEWDESNPGVAVRAEQLLLESSEGPVEIDLRIPTGTVWTVEHDDPRWRSALVWTLAGWRKPGGGRLGVLGSVLPEESGAVRKKVRVVPTTSPDESDLTVRQYLRSVLVAQSRHPWRPGDAVEQALDQSEAWLDPLSEVDSRTQTRLEDRRLGALSAVERQLVALSAATAQHPQLVLVQDADAGLGSVEMSWFSGVCHELVADTGMTVVLVGDQVGQEGDSDTGGDGTATVAATTPEATDPGPTASVAVEDADMSDASETASTGRNGVEAEPAVVGAPDAEATERIPAVESVGRSGGALRDEPAQSSTEGERA
jgi:RND superfamily putative drug exporter